MEELYGVDVSPDLISTVTDAVLEEVTEWQRPLLPLNPVIVFDALGVRIRGEGTVRAKAVYPGPGIAPDGTKDVLGLWIEQTKGAKFLAPGDARAEVPGRGGRPGGGSRRAQRLPRGDHHRLPSGDAANLHRAPAALLARLRHLAAS